MTISFNNLFKRQKNRKFQWCRSFRIIVGNLLLNTSNIATHNFPINFPVQKAFASFIKSKTYCNENSPINVFIRSQVRNFTAVWISNKAIWPQIMLQSAFAWTVETKLALNEIQTTR